MDPERRARREGLLTPDGVASSRYALTIAMRLRRMRSLAFGSTMLVRLRRPGVPPGSEDRERFESIVTSCFP